MSIISLICKQCGGELSLDDSKDIGFCQHCGTKILIQEEKVTINQNYNTTQHIVKNIYGREKTESEEYLQNGESYLKLDEIDKAIKEFDKAIEANPGDYKTWLAKLKAVTNNFSDFTAKNFEHLSEKVMILIPEGKKEEFEKTYNEYHQTNASTQYLYYCKKLIDANQIIDFDKPEKIYELSVLRVLSKFDTFAFCHSGFLNRSYAPNLKTIYFPKNFDFNSIQQYSKINACEYIVHPDDDNYYSYDGMIVCKENNYLSLCPSCKSKKLVIPKDIKGIERNCFHGIDLFNPNGIQEIVLHDEIESLESCPAQVNKIIIPEETKIAGCPFKYWGKNRTIYFRCSKKDAKQRFDKKWNYGCKAKIVWDYKGD